MKQRIFLIIVICLFPVLNSNVFSQQSSGSLSGIVTEFENAVVPYATITIKFKSQTTESVSRGVWKTVSSNDTGEYSLQNLPAGIYEVKVDSMIIGMPYNNENVEVFAGRPTKMNIHLTYGKGCENNNGQTIDLNETDKAKIVNEILEDSLGKKTIGIHQSFAGRKEPIILSTGNIKAEWTTPIKKFKLRLMSENEIRNEAEIKGTFLYLSFDKFEIKGQCLIVTLSNSWSRGKKTTGNSFGSGGSVYRYYKKSGRLSGKYIGGWIS